MLDKQGQAVAAREARAAGIKPILVTPLTRRYFEADGKIHSDLAAHAETMKRVAAQMKVPVIDLHQDSIAYLDRIGAKDGNTLAITKKDEDGKTIFDKTHLDWKGSYVFGRIVAVDMGKAVTELAKYVKPEAATLPPEGVNVYDLLRHDTLILSQQAAKALEERCLKQAISRSSRQGGTP